MSYTYTKDQLNDIYNARGAYFIILIAELKRWNIITDDEQKMIDSIVEVLEKYGDFLQEKLDELEKQD